MMFIVMNALGCVFFLPSLFSIFVWINVICVIATCILVLWWSGRTATIEYVQSNLTTSIELRDLDSDPFLDSLEND